MLFWCSVKSTAQEKIENLAVPARPEALNPTAINGHKLLIISDFLLELLKG